jgi:hypothetical protein
MENIPNDQKITKWRQNTQTFSIPRPSKNYPNWNFRYENIPSGKNSKNWNFCQSDNPGLDDLQTLRHLETLLKRMKNDLPAEHPDTSCRPCKKTQAH